MRYISFFLLFFLMPNICFAEDNDEGSTLGASQQKIIVPPPAVEKIDPCAQGQCDYAEKHKKRRGFGSKRGKALSSFGKGSRRKKTGGISGGHRRGRARGTSHYSFKNRH